MSDPLRPLRVNAVELLRQPGAERPVVDSIAAPALGVAHPRLAVTTGAPATIEIDLVLRSNNDGILVDGTVAAPWEAPCRRCLQPLAGRAEAVVDELYQTEIVDPEAFPIENGQLDLVPMVRETILLELDDEVLCRPDCAGLCPVCGADRNEVDCGCDTVVGDARWAALADVRLDPDS